MRTTRIAWILFSAATSGTLACGDKMHSDVDTLGPAAVQCPPGGCGQGQSGGAGGAGGGTAALVGANVFLLGRCTQSCQMDGDCPANSRCLRTAQGSNGCVTAPQAACGSCPTGTSCEMGVCRTTCSTAGGCASDQACVNSSCYGAPGHD